MLRKLLIVPWFGPLPAWRHEYVESVLPLLTEGYDFLFDTDEAAFHGRVSALLDVTCPPLSGNGKIHDYRPAFGLLYADELRGYDFWGHTDMDCVYGNVSGFMPDERLADLDVYSDHWDYLCGPWTLYRHTPNMETLFMDAPGARARLTDPMSSGWVETDWTRAVNTSGLRVHYELNHGWEAADRLTTDGNRLYEDGEEISFFHFRHTKQWPIVRRETLCQV